MKNCFTCIYRCLNYNAESYCPKKKNFVNRFTEICEFYKEGDSGMNPYKENADEK